VRAQQWLGFGGQRARLEFLLPSHTAIGTDHIWAMQKHWSRHALGHGTRWVRRRDVPDFRSSADPSACRRWFPGEQAAGSIARERASLTIQTLIDADLGSCTLGSGQHCQRRARHPRCIAGAPGLRRSTTSGQGGSRVGWTSTTPRNPTSTGCVRR
jgi:hypothetical protein